MSEQDVTQSSPKQRRSRKTSPTNKENGNQASAVQHPAHDDTKAWIAHWKEQGQHWRIEPEIDEERQKYLTERRTLSPDIEQGIYPFKDIKLTRADVEWLLATHDNGHGPIDWSDESQRNHEGLDLRGANLRQLNLSNLPLTRLRGGLNQDERMFATVEMYDMAAINLEEAILRKIHLEGADLYRARLGKVDLYGAFLEQAYLVEAHLTGANLFRTHLERTQLRRTHLQNVKLGRAKLVETELEDAAMSDEKHVGPRLADANWSNTNLSAVNWMNVKMLDDEYIAHQRVHYGKVKERNRRLSEYKRAVRANRQLAVELHTQGLNEDAARFNYRAQLLQRKVLRYQYKFGQYLFSGFLDLLAGYGYRPGRSVLWYLAIIVSFSLTYHFLGGLPLYPPDAFVFSIMSFHGRGFFPALKQETNLHNPLVMLAALEAIIGLLVEISFIATFTQRFFGK